MAKSDSFFIRKTVNIDNTNAFFQSAIDCGAYVDALGKSVLRIRNLSVQYGDPTDTIVIPDGQHRAGFQVTTQSQGSMVAATDKSLISSGSLFYTTSVANGNPFISEALDIAPQHWTNGYLVGVEQIYLGVDASEASSGGMTAVNIVMECTVETLSSSAAMALALSQQ